MKGGHAVAISPFPSGTNVGGRMQIFGSKTNPFSWDLFVAAGCDDVCMVE
jgi:hypothetical protein